MPSLGHATPALCPSSCHSGADGRKTRAARGAEGGGGQRDPADLLTRSRDPGATIGGDAPVGHKPGKGMGADGRGATGDPVDMLTALRPDPDAELLDGGVPPMPGLSLFLGIGALRWGAWRQCADVGQGMTGVSSFGLWRWPLGAEGVAVPLTLPGAMGIAFPPGLPHMAGDSAIRLRQLHVAVAGYRVTWAVGGGGQWPAVQEGRRNGEPVQCDGSRLMTTSLCPA